MNLNINTDKNNYNSYKNTNEFEYNVISILQTIPFIRKRDLIEKLRTKFKKTRGYSVEKYPINYADTQNNLGTAYMVLSGVRNKETNVENAIIAFQKALNVYISEEYPIKYNNTLNNIKKAMEFG